jgi:clan AA aspartic protease (TIGR02281 family)
MPCVRKIPVIFIATLFLLSSYLAAQADTLYLKNGRSLEGIIKREEAGLIELDVGFGTIAFEKSQIKEILRSTPQEINNIRQGWEKKKIELERQPKQVDFSRQQDAIVVGTRLNNRADCLLILDTGASVVVLRKSIAAELGIDLDRTKPDAKLTLADGRQVNAKHIILDTVQVENVEAKNVDAVIMLEETGEGLEFSDGLLGMSFLKKFKFQVDHKQGKLLLEQY